MNKFTKYFMSIAILTSKLSHCKRKQVGAILVKNNSIISIGYNGTPSNEDNNCEDDENGLTLNNVIHAEDNVFRKLYNSHETAKGAELYCTLFPCCRCTDILIDSKIKKLIYLDEYGNSEVNIKKLNDNNIEVIKYDKL